MVTRIRLCRDCKHFSRFADGRCMRPIAPTFSLVYGTVERGLFRLAEEERKAPGFFNRKDRRCGPDACFFEAKPPCPEPPPAASDH